MRTTAVIAIVLACATARAGESEDDDQRVVVVNAAPKLGSLGPISRLRRVLDSRNLLVKLSGPLEATLDGRNALVADIDAIKDAYANGDWELALKIIENDESRILEQVVGRDPVPALAELSQWRAMIAIKLNQRDEAMRWFRAAYRFNPAWTVDKKLVSPPMRSIIKRAKVETTETGTLRVDTDPNDSTISIDGVDTKPANEKVTLPVGIHLVMITATKRKPYAELVDIKPNEVFRIDINLDEETTLDRAARLVDATAAAPAGKVRLKRARALAKLTGHSRILVIEDGDDDRVLARLYDVDSKKVSKQLELERNLSSAAIAREIVAALDPENLVDVNTIVITQRPAAEAPTPWYKRWYVWAAVGAVAVGGFATYEYVSRDPTSVRGF